MLSEEEKETIDRLYNKATLYSVEAPDYPNTIVFKKDLVRILNLIEKQQKEIQNLQNDNIEKDLMIDGLREERRLAAEEIQEQYFVSKDKIREKIKDLEDYMILFTNDKEKFNRYKYARDILEKLLKEE